MRPFDPRLVRHARATRGYLVISTAVGVASVLLIIAQATLLAQAITRVASSRFDLPLLGLASVVAGRALLAWLQEVAAHRASAAVKSELRSRVLADVVDRGPSYLHGAPGELATLVSRGLDSLDAYFARYLPQLLLAATVPLVILAWIVPVDLVAGLTIAITLPLIPLFMALVGLSTEKLNRRQFAALARLGHHLLELIAGLPTLKVFGRARQQARAIRDLTDAQRRLTMRTLRLAFLSSLVLELLSTLSVALVAVGIGLRVVNGSLDLRTALIVLILAPEAYLPLRALGTQYHAAGEGLAAAQRVFDILDARKVRQPGTRPAPPPGPVVVDGVCVTYPGRTRPALAPVSLELSPGETVAIVGPSGVGKTTLALVLAGLVAPTAGQVLVSSVQLADIAPEQWRRRVAYVPQHPYLFAGTVAANIDLADTHTAAEVAAAARSARFDGDLSTVVGEDGAGLSAGQRRRVALSRAFLQGGDLVILDEPTANLDLSTEAELIDTIRRLATPNRTLVIVAHRPALVAAADRVVNLAPELALAA